MNPFKEQLLHLFEYDRERGVLLWRNPPKGKGQLIGHIAGCLRHRSHTSYLRLAIGRKYHFVHKLIWFIEYEELSDVIDHIDGNGLNNCISNLRNVSHRTNMQNQKVHRKGKLVGTSFWNGGWRSRITIEGKEIRLGNFNTEQEAHARYLSALKEYGL